MRRILTEAEIALDAKRDEHRKKWMGRIGRAQTGAELEAVLSKVTAMEGNPVETNTTRRLPKRYLEQYRTVIQPLVILGWSLEEIREVLQRISARRITHQLVLTYVEKISVENHESDIAEAIKAGRRIHSSAERKEIVAQSDRRTAQLLSVAPVTELVKKEPPHNLGEYELKKSPFGDYPDIDLSGHTITIANSKRYRCMQIRGSFCPKDHVDEYSYRHWSMVVASATPTLQQFAEGEKLLESISKAKGRKQVVPLTDAAVWILYLMERHIVRNGALLTDEVAEELIAESLIQPFLVTKWKWYHNNLAPDDQKHRNPSLLCTHSI